MVWCDARLSTVAFVLFYIKKLSTGAMRGYLLWVMCIFLILVRRRLYGRMGMGFTGRGMRMIDIEWLQNMGMENRKGRT
jgi:hypothetical protein